MFMALTIVLMAQQRQPGSPSNAAQLALASDDVAQPSSLPGSAEQPADEGCRRARDGKLYTRAQFQEHYGSYMGEEHWQNAQDELMEWDGPADVSAEQLNDESYRRAWDGKHHTRAQFHAHYGFYLGEEHWQKALDELTQRDEPANVGAIGAPRLRSAEQPASSLHRAAQLASDVQPQHTQSTPNT